MVVYVTLGQLRFSTAIFQVFLGAKIDKEKVVSTESDHIALSAIKLHLKHF